MRVRIWTVAASVALLATACSDDNSSPSTETDTAVDVTEDTGADTADATETDAGDDAAADTGEDTGDDAGEDIGDDAADVEEDTFEPPNCDDDERAVGARCAGPFDRLCVSDDDCETQERCERIDDEGYGTCVWQLDAPLVCPGSEGCASDEGPMRAAFARRVITPSGWELGRPGSGSDFDEWGNPRKFDGDVTRPDTFCDCGIDMICPPTEEFADCPSFGEYTGPDADGTEGDGYMQGAWIAGFGNNRNAQLCLDEWLADDCEGTQCCVSRLAHDHMWARGGVIERGDTRVAIITLDSVGWFYSDIRRIRDQLDPAWGIDELIMTATHSHEVPDHMGRWGPGVFGSGLPTDTGVIPEHMEEIYVATLELIEEAVTNLEPVDVYVSKTNTGHEGFATRDSRHPFIFNDLLTTVRFVRDGEDPMDTDATVGTMVNWHSHPESLSSGNMYISSDFPHYLREYLENGFPEAIEDTVNGVTWPAREGLGGTVVYTSGTVGGLLNPLSWEARDLDGQEYASASFDKAHALGARLAQAAFGAMEVVCEDGATNDCLMPMDETLSVAGADFFLDIVNIQFQTAGISLDLFNRPIYNYRADAPLEDNVYPQVLTRVSQVRIGNLTFQSWPGELFPEQLVGGYSPDNVYDNVIVGNPRDVNCDETRRIRLDAGVEPRFPCLLEERTENPPDLDAAPTEGYYREWLDTEYFYTLGLGQDAIGYLVPSYDFKVDPFVGALIEVDGDHYEETVATGDNEAPIRDAIRILDDLLDAM